VGNPVCTKQPKDTRLANDLWTFVKTDSFDILGLIWDPGNINPGMYHF